MGSWEWSDVLTQFGQQWSRVLGIGLLVLLYKLGLFTAKPSKLHIQCDSPSCVRCRTYTSRSRKFLHNKWSNYIKDVPKSERMKFHRITETTRHYEAQPAEEHTIFELQNLSTQPCYDRKFFENDVKLLEDNFTKIHTEFSKIFNFRESSNIWKVNSTPSGKWSAFYLINQGQEIKDNIQFCPDTYDVLKQLQKLMTGCIFGNACFSVIEPGTIISEHYGPCNIRVRCHLGIEVPQGCELFVNHRKVQWQESKCILFDDSYLHSVIYRKTSCTDQPRAVFMVDLWHPDLTFDEIKGLRFLLDPSKSIK
ncbi:aspartate beta-hydroxylase domain-containing protein 2-like [Styela clava]